MLRGLSAFFFIYSITLFVLIVFMFVNVAFEQSFSIAFSSLFAKDSIMNFTSAAIMFAVSEYLGKIADEKESS